jgi:hypothetical protein
MADGKLSTWVPQTAGGNWDTFQEFLFFMNGWMGQAGWPGLRQQFLLPFFLTHFFSPTGIRYYLASLWAAVG